MATERLGSPGFQAVIETVSSDAFRQALSLQTGYATSDSGKILPLQ